MKRLLPAPFMSLLLALTWLLLNESASVGNLLLAALFGIAIPWWTERFRAERPRLKNFGVLARLLLVVLKDIVLSNITVARQVLGPESAIEPRFVWVPLSLRDPHGIVLLAGIITMTPGTLSSDLSDDRRHLLVHALHCTDEAGLIADIKARYEAPLIEVFES